MTYIDGLVIPVRKNNLAAYRSMAKKSAKIWREYGALEIREYVADDIPFGKRTSFPRSVKLKRGETVDLSWVVYRSRAQRNRILAKVMKDKRIAAMMSGKDIPFDGKRMIVGGFKPLISL